MYVHSTHRTGPTVAGLISSNQRRCRRSRARIFASQAQGSSCGARYGTARMLRGCLTAESFNGRDMPPQACIWAADVWSATSVALRFNPTALDAVQKRLQGATRVARSTVVGRNSLDGVRVARCGGCPPLLAVVVAYEHPPQLDDGPDSLDHHTNSHLFPATATEPASHQLSAASISSRSLSCCPHRPASIRPPPPCAAAKLRRSPRPSVPKLRPRH